MDSPLRIIAGGGEEGGREPLNSNDPATPHLLACRLPAATPTDRPGFGESGQLARASGKKTTTISNMAPESDQPVPV